MGTVVVIPAFNESRSIADVVLRASLHVDRVIVVDDGSTDGTAAIARDCGAEVVQQENQGVGAAVRCGLRIAVSSPDTEMVVLMDGDGQHDPDDLDNIVKAVQDGCDLAIGRRDFNLQSMPVTRLLANWVFFLARNFGSGQVIQDGECGYRAFSRRALSMIGIDTKSFGFCEEVAIKARSLGLVIREVPVSTIYGEEQYRYAFTVKVWHGAGVLISIIKWRWLFEWKPRIRLFGARKILSSSGSTTSPRSPAIR